MIGLLAFFLLGPLCEAGPLERFPYIQRLSTDSALVAWKTALEDTALECGGRRLKPQSRGHLRWVEVKGLRSGTRYDYRVLSGGKPLTSGLWFQTAPAAGDARYRDFTFAVFGDAGFNRFENGRWLYDGVFERDPRVNTQFAVARAITARAPDLLLTTGDNISDIGKEINYDPQMFCPYQEMLTRIPICPSLGNHDYYGGTQTKEPLAPEDENAQPFYRNLFLPLRRGGNGDPQGAYYSFDYGDAHFVALNTVRPNYVDYRPGSPQLRWFEDDLKSTRKRWKIVYFHYPVYSSTQTAPKSLPIRLKETKEYIEPLLVRYGVDMVFSGHTHSYQRSYPQRGVTYVVTGGGGRSADKIVSSGESWNAVTREGFNFVIARVKADSIEIDATFLDGAHDRFTIRKR